MAIRDNKKIPLGSGEIFAVELTGDTMPEYAAVCVEDNRLGYIKSGASLEYAEETYEEKDDLGYVSKIITTSEEVILKCGLITWSGDTLQKLIDRAKAAAGSDTGKRVTKIGGANNAKGKVYAICFKHTDKIDGDIYVLIKGRNTAGVTMTFATDAGSLIEPEFRAMPHDSDGTLVEFIEVAPSTAST